MRMDHLFPDGAKLHQIIAHIPIVVLLVAPVLVLIGIALQPARRDLFLAVALGLMVFGTLAAFAAVGTGEAALRVVGSAPGAQATLEEHRRLADSTVELFSVLTVGFGFLLFAPKLLHRRIEPHLNTALLAIYLVFYATGSLFLVHTALQGAHLVRALEANTTASCHLAGKEIAR